MADEAANWFTLLHAGEADQRAGWRAWHDAHPDHARAWSHLERVIGALPDLNPGGMAYRTLKLSPRTRDRRRLLTVAAGLVTAGGAGWLAVRSEPWQNWRADYASATGMQRRFILPDGTEMTLDTASRATLHYDGHLRRVHLLAGSALFTTAHPPGPASALPFVVETGEGRVRALGTRFTVRQDSGTSRVAVLEGAVEITSTSGSSPLRLQAGQVASFQIDHAGPVTTLNERDRAWNRGLLIADNQRLDEFLAELSRYRTGWLQADPAVAGLRFSGVFPLNLQANANDPADRRVADTDAILALLPNSLPVQIRWRTRWWVTVGPA